MHLCPHACISSRAAARETIVARAPNSQIGCFAWPLGHVPPGGAALSSNTTICLSSATALSSPPCHPDGSAIVLANGCTSSCRRPAVSFKGPCAGISWPEHRAGILVVASGFQYTVAESYPFPVESFVWREFQLIIIRNMDKRSIGVLDSQEHSVRPPVMPAKTHRKTG